MIPLTQHPQNDKIIDRNSLVLAELGVTGEEVGP
jgi:hypothetical protein